MVVSVKMPPRTRLRDQLRAPINSSEEQPQGRETIDVV